MRTRQEEIHDPYPTTFENSVNYNSSKKESNEESDENSENKLLDWLEDGTGVFWINDKPGSGKSSVSYDLVLHT